jgi:hypothetical protein
MNFRDIDPNLYVLLRKLLLDGYLKDGSSKAPPCPDTGCRA